MAIALARTGVAGTAIAAVLFGANALSGCASGAMTTDEFRAQSAGLGNIENIEVKAGKVRSIGDRLILTIDEGSIAFIRGSVFDVDGRSVPNAKVELAKLLDDGTIKKIDGRLTTETGSFVFRLSPETAKYRVSLKSDGGDPISRDVEIDGAAVYRVALSKQPAPKP